MRCKQIVWLLSPSHEQYGPCLESFSEDRRAEDACTECFFCGRQRERTVIIHVHLSESGRENMGKFRVSTKERHLPLIDVSCTVRAQVSTTQTYAPPLIAPSTFQTLAASQLASFAPSQVKKHANDSRFPFAGSAVADPGHMWLD